MKEIKFRQWIPISKDFHYWGMLGKGHFVSPITGNEKIPEKHEQFIDKNDKKGVEIYEGDNCMVYYEYPIDHTRASSFRSGRVVFANSAFCIELPIIDGTSLFTINQFDNIEVIGNIHTGE